MVKQTREQETKTMYYYIRNSEIVSIGGYRRRASYGMWRRGLTALEIERIQQDNLVGLAAEISKRLGTTTW